MDATDSVWQSVKPNKYCSCGYKCDCLQLIVKNKISTKRLFLRLEKENESDINLALSLNEFGFDEILNQFNHFKYCKAYHSIFHEKRFNRIKRKPFAFHCLHHLEQLESSEVPHIIHQLIDKTEEESSLEVLENNLDEIVLNGSSINHLHLNNHILKEINCKDTNLIENNLKENNLKEEFKLNYHHHESADHSNSHHHTDLNEIIPNENESLISTHDFVNLNNLTNNYHHYETNSIDLKEIKCIDEELNIKFRQSLDNSSLKYTFNSPTQQSQEDESSISKKCKITKKKKKKKNSNELNGINDERRKSIRTCCSKFALIRRYINPFLCLLNILLIIVDFTTDILIARYHFISENYISTSITFCFIYWAAYMHFLFETNFSKKLDLFKRKFKFINLNNVSTDLIIGIIHLFLPVKVFIESIYLVYNMYKWELRLINCRNEDKHHDIEVALRVCLRRAHKSNLILALFKAFPQFLFQYYHYVYYLTNKDDEPLNWLFVITILSSLVTYIKNSYCGDLYYIEDNLNKNFEELRFLDIIKFNYLPFRFNIVLFIYNLTEFLLNFPFFLMFYTFKSYDSILNIFKSYESYFFICYIILFFKSYVTFFKNYLTSMKLEKDEDASWKKDILFIRKRTHSHVNYLFILRLIVSGVFLISLSNTFNAKYYYLILFFFFMLLAITAVGYILKTIIISDQLINLKNFIMWKAIFRHLEFLNGFSIYNERLFNQWLEKIIFENYYFQWKLLFYNFFKR